MNYSTLKEAYSIDSFDKEKKKSKKSKTAKIEEFEVEDDSSDISQRDVKNINNIKNNQPERTISRQPHEKPNVLKGVQPHYDEELEKYLNVNDFQDNNLHYYPQDHTHSYKNTNFSSPQQNNSYIGYENNGKYEPKQPYYRPVARSYDTLNDQYVEKPVRQQSAAPTEPSMKFRPIQSVEQSENNFEMERRQRMNYSEPPLPPRTIPNVKSPEKAIVEEKETFYKNLVNIGLFVFIGILIIFLCEQITEIAINIGMKKTIMILEPYMKKEVRK